MEGPCVSCVCSLASTTRLAARSALAPPRLKSRVAAARRCSGRLCGVWVGFTPCDVKLRQRKRAFARQSPRSRSAGHKGTCSRCAEARWVNEDKETG